MVINQQINQPLISISDNLKQEKDLIIHVKFWQSKIELVNIINEESQFLKDIETNYQQLAQSIQAVSSYSESWRESLNKIIEYQTTIRALEDHQVKVFSLSRDSEPPSPDPLKNQREICLNQLNNLNQLQSKVEELEKILSQTIKAIYRLGKQESYSEPKIWYLCRSFCQITLKEYQIIRNQMETEPDKISTWQFLSLRNQIWQNITEGVQFPENSLNQVFLKSVPNKLTDSGENFEDLKAYLQQQFSYCPCVEGTVTFLKSLLKLMNNSENNQLERWRQSNLIQLQQLWESHPLLFTWFIFNLEEKGLIWHGFKITDCWLTDKGLQLLSVLNKLEEKAESAGISMEDYLSA